MENQFETANKSGGKPRFQGEVLNKVYKVWLLRKLLPVLVLEVVVLSGILYFLGRTVFIQRVFENALTVFFLSPPRIIVFLVNAFTGAPTLTKILALVFIVFIAFLLRHLTQGILRLILVRLNYFSRVERG